MKDLGRLSKCWIEQLQVQAGQHRLRHCTDSKDMYPVQHPWWSQAARTVSLSCSSDHQPCSVAWSQHGNCRWLQLLSRRLHVLAALQTHGILPYRSSGVFGQHLFNEYVDDVLDSEMRHPKHSGDHPGWCLTCQPEEKHQGLNHPPPHPPNVHLPSWLRRSSSIARASLLSSNKTGCHAVRNTAEEHLGLSCSGEVCAGLGTGREEKTIN